MNDCQMDHPNTNAAFVDRPISKIHKFYLVGDIKPPGEYVEWFEQIRGCPESDVVMLHINSYGGDLFTAIQFLRILTETKATVVVSVEGACMSAATIVFMAANHFEISNHSMFMFHNYSSLATGKGGELYDNIIHQRAWSENLWHDIYKDFLTVAEITTILHNKDIWMTGEEVVTRLEKKFGTSVGNGNDTTPKISKISKKPIAGSEKKVKAATAMKKTKAATATKKVKKTPKGMHWSE